MYCENCGKKLEKGMLFCDNCGHKVEFADTFVKTEVYDRIKFKNRAKNALKGKWFILFIFILLCNAIVAITSSFLIGVLLPPIFILSTHWATKDIIKGNDVDFNWIIKPFSDFNQSLRAIGAFFLISIITFFGMLLIIPGIIFSLMYSQTLKIIADDKEIGVIDAMRKSSAMMRGHKWEYFCFMFSFIGHALLVLITFGLWAIYLTPYLYTSYTIYYLYVAGQYEEKNRPTHYTPENNYYENNSNSKISQEI